MNIMKMPKKSVVMLAFAVLLVCPMIFGWTMVKADDETSEMAKAQLYMDFLGVESEEHDGPYEVAQNNAGLGNAADVGTVFWVGIRIDDVSKVDFLKNGGLHDLDIGIEYDPVYVIPCYDLDNPAATENGTTWRAGINKYNFGTSSNLVWDSTNYELGVGSSYKATVTALPGRENAVDADWLMQFVTIMKNDDVTTDNRFKGIIDDTQDDGYYLVRVPFRIIKVPENGNKPDVLQLSLSGNNFAMTSGEGLDVYSWASSEYQESNPYNLGNYFNYNGDLNIFMESGVDALTKLEISYSVEDEAGNSDDVAVDLYTDEEREGGVQPFKTSQKTYYVSVSATAEQLKLKLGSQLFNEPLVDVMPYQGEQPTGSSVSLSRDDNLGYWIAKADLRTDVETSGYVDTIKIVVNSEKETEETYYIHVFREVDKPVTGKPYIKLYPGNSPYGEIMKDDTVWRTYTFVDDDADYNNKSDAEKKAKWQELAKASFAENDAFIDESLTPVSMSAQRTAGVKYGIAAWLNMVNPAAPSEEELAEAAKADVNMDRNDATIFVYNYESFVAPVVEAVDSAGNTVQLNGSVVVNRIKNTGVSKTYLDLVDNAVEESTIQIEGGKLNEALTTGTYVRPDKYEIKYSYTDANSGETITATRYMVVLGRFADTTDLDNVAGGNDLGYFNEIIKYSGVPAGFVKGENIADSPHRVFSIRVADTNYDNLVNGNDSSLVNNIIATGGRLELTEYYAKLPTAIN